MISINKFNRFSINDALELITTKNAFKGVMIDFTQASPEVVFSKPTLKKGLRSVVSRNKQASTHVISLKVPSHSGSVMEVAIDCGFRHHNANPKYSMLNLCLENHSVEACTFPAHKTISAGITAIIFNADGTKVLLVREKLGITNKDKPVTGSIDYEKQGTPLDTVVREVKEETGVNVESSQAKLVAVSWTNNYRENNPDISYFFAFKLESEQILTAQTSEISKVEWVDVLDFIMGEKDKLWQQRQAVMAAYRAMQFPECSWEHKTTYLTNGKPVQFYSAPTRE